jgi:hypothetical protein
LSNPYGGGYEPPPYGEPEPAYQPYGSPPPATAPSPYGPPKQVDGVSIAGFVLSLVCCPLVGLVLGVVGLRRTQDDRRTGRWAAIAAVVIGGLGTIAGIAFGVFVVWFGTHTVSVEDADPGQCVDVDDDTLWTKECSEAHDAEVAYQGELDAERLQQLEELRPEEFCELLVGADYADVLAADEYGAGVVVDAVDADDPEPGDAFVCYVDSTNGAKLDGRLVG